MLLSKRAFKEAKKNRFPKNVVIVNSDFEKASFQEKFDVIIASHVACYFKEKKKAVQKMLGLLRKNGKLLIVVNGKKFHYGKLKNYLSRMAKEEYASTYDEIVAAIKDLKFKFKFNEYCKKSSLHFKSVNELYGLLGLLFGCYKKDYKKFEQEIKEFLARLKSNKFIIEQKILVVTK